MISKQNTKKILLLGTRGIPAGHGGFETFLENLAPYLSTVGWDVTVYCQKKGKKRVECSYYKNVRLIHIYVPQNGTLGTIYFDWLSMLHALKQSGLMVSFGYPTGFMAILPRIIGRSHIINMDGIEWKRSQFGLLGRIWYYINERFAAVAANLLIADHPEIHRHLSTRAKSNKIKMIPYGANSVQNGLKEVLEEFGLLEANYGVVVARPEPDNSILEIVRSFSKRRRNMKLVILGNYNQKNSYHKQVLEAASEEVIFLGAIYDQEKVASLRFFSRFYVHGHKVGGTNPSLVEALGAGNAIIARKNSFNAWVAQDAALYFNDDADLDWIYDELGSNDDLRSELQAKARNQHSKKFMWDKILSEYERTFLDVLNNRSGGS